MSFLRSSARLLLPHNVSYSVLYEQNREIKRWVAPVLREINRRKKKMGPQPITPRSSFIEWNYNAELFAFSKRLNENFDLGKLQQAFLNRSYIVQEEQKQRELGIENPNIALKDNLELIEQGEALIKSYVESFLKMSMPKMPTDLIASIQYNLTSDKSLAHISYNVGAVDLVLSSDFPVQDGTMADTLKAVVGSLALSSGELKAFTFIRDFICTQLNQKDLAECCQIENPFNRLKEVCKEMKLTEPEPRLIGDSAKNTVLAAYHVGIYCDKKLIGTGFGETIPTATDLAAYDALRNIWGFPDYMKPFDFNMELEQLSKQSKQEKIN